MAAKATLTIGELAARTGLTPDALRYYERLGLIPPDARTPGGFRAYPAATINRLLFVKQPQRQGLTLAEVCELLRLDTHRDTGHCPHVQRLLRRKLTDLDARLLEMQKLRRAWMPSSVSATRRSRNSPTPRVP